MENNFELKYLRQHQSILFCDEVGRGPIAGPVVSCSVIYPNSKSFIEVNSMLIDLGIDDSKKLSTKKRKAILKKLGIDLVSLEKNLVYNKSDFSFVINEQTPEMIDEINILQASLLSMGQGCRDLILNQNPLTGVVLVDGNKTFDLEKISSKKIKNEQFEVVSIIKGDAKSAGISLASVIAKEYRDYLMEQLDVLYPGYGLARHAGYPTKAHKEAVCSLGVSPIHRRSFKGVKEHI
jgi:ribonuclease HII